MGKIHLIGNAHIDPVWLWRWQEGYTEVLSTFRSALDRINEFDDFVFTCAGAIYYQWVEKTDPEMFEEIRQAVAQGKWVIVGGWMLQPDCNAPCGESFARHGLYAQNYFLEKFGVTATVGYNVDSFGHSGALPQILKKSGLKAYVYMRPSPDTEKVYPFPNQSFLWTSPDGEEIPTYRIHYNYGSLPFGESVDKALEMQQISDGLGGEQVMCFYGVGNHGGGPTVDNILALKKLQEENERGNEFVFSSPNRFFEELEIEKLPKYSGDIHHHASGCYTAVMQIKALNRVGESHILSAERAGVMADLLGFKIENKSLKDAWRTVLFNQFHDIMGGCCIRSAVEDAVIGYGHSIHCADVIENESLQAIAWNIDTSKGQLINLNKRLFKAWESENMGTPVIVFNTNAYDVKEPVRIGSAFRSVEDENGNPVEFYQARAEQTNGPDDRYESEIIAQVPAMGWRLYWGYMKKENEFSVPRIPEDVEENVFEKQLLMENDLLKVEFSDSLFVKSIFDKAKCRNIVSGQVKPIVIDDTESDTWAHAKFVFDDVVGEFSDGKVIYYNKNNVCEHVRISYRYNLSEITADYRLYKGSDELRISFSVNWQEKLKILKICFPTEFENGKDFAAAPYGFTVREADGKEQPMQKWVAAIENGYGLGVATDTRSAYSFKDGEMRISCLRSAIFADHFGKRDVFCEYSEQGEHRFSLAVRPIEDDFHELQKTGELMLKPLFTVFGTYHKGSLPGKCGLINVSDENVMITSVKAAEDGNGFIVNCSETDGKSCERVISIPTANVEFSATFRPMEVRSFRIADGKAQEVDFLEKPI